MWPCDADSSDFRSPQSLWSINKKERLNQIKRGIKRWAQMDWPTKLNCFHWIPNKVQWGKLGLPIVRILLKIHETDIHRVIFRLIFGRLLITEWETWAQGWSWSTQPWMTMRRAGQKTRGGNRTTIFCNEIEVLLFFNTLSITPITAEVHQDAVSSGGAPSACPARPTTCMFWMASMRYPVRYPSHSHWPQPPPHLAHRCPDKCFFFRRLRGLALNIYFLKMGSDPTPCVKRW